LPIVFGHVVIRPKVAGKSAKFALDLDVTIVVSGSRHVRFSC